MLKSLIFFARFFLFWLLYFLLDRLIFIVIYVKNIPEVSFLETVAVFYHAVRLDMAMAAYTAVIPLLYFIACWLIHKDRIGFSWLNYYQKTLIILFSLIGVVNINIYREWGSKVNAKAIEFAVFTPNEALASSESSPFFFNIFLLALLIALGWILNKWLVRNEIVGLSAPLWLKITCSLLLIGLNFLVIRGGWGVSPNNQSMAYYSDKQLLNHAAVNTEWNLVSSLLRDSRHAAKNPYLFFPEADAEQVVEDLYRVEKDTTIHILTNNRPNVVVIIMESFTADLTNTLGQEVGITPHFDSLINKGVLFSKIYSTGNRTDKGIIGTLTGQPSLAAENIVKYPEKLEKITALSQVFYQQGYGTSFFYGGQSEFDNLKAFTLSHDYQALTDKSSFNPADMNSKWGAYDGIVFNRQLRDLNAAKQPFFSTQMTLTNHEPFEVPGKYKFGKADNVARFKSTAFYTDSCLNDFLNKAKAQPWYKNTLFIFVADHGHIMPKGRDEIYIPERYHIPLLFFGDVIKAQYRGKVFDQVGSQIDIASTLLHQLGLDASKFSWSKNLLNPNTKPFAFFSWDNGMGFMDNKQCVTFDNVGKMTLYNNKPQDSSNSAVLLRNAQSYLQSAYQQFLQR
jgi:phosphoglycerol transferase MdoB-like AlkP superfamily enzyme